jgi:2-iminobutanoate/2-iminopropanoate deaminase
MKHVIDTGLHDDGGPIEWAVRGGNTLYTVQIPVHPDGKIETGSMDKQARLAFANLKTTVEAAGGTLDDVTQVIIYLTDKEGFAEMHRAFQDVFSAPYPNRATVIVAGLMVPDARIEIVAYAHLGS